MTILVPLEESVLEISGQEAASYLQGQTTCDVLALKRGGAQLAALCNLKGRVEATFWLFRVEENRFLMVVPEELFEPVLSRLRRYKLRTRVDFTPSSLKSFGLFGQPPEFRASASPGIFLSFKVPFSGFRLLAEPDELFPALAARGTIHLKPETFWQLREIEAGLPTVLPETSGAFLPQMLDLDRLGAVSFTKGCYLGQEVVARAQHRGEVKRRLFYGEIRGKAPLLPGSELLRGEEVVGQVVGAAFDEESNRTKLLAVVRVDAVEGPLTIRSGQKLTALRRAHPKA